MAIEVAELNLEARVLLDQYVGTTERVALGPVVEKNNINSSLSPFRILPEYRTAYPETVVEALGKLYAEYNKAFQPLIDSNREWDTDYRYCVAPDGTPLNGWVQIDMVGLPAGFLKASACLDEEDVREALRGRIFEIENSLAMYQLLENLFSNGRQETFFKRQFRASLHSLKGRFGKPIALLAVTDQKYQAMRESEFGKVDGEPLSDDEVRDLSGFDRFFGPEEFCDHVANNQGHCGYLLYVRSSDPVAKLKKPETMVENPLLENEALRRVIKANTVTINIDAPDMNPARRINDTKEYLLAMGIGFGVNSEADILSSEFSAHLSTGKAFADYPAGERLSPAFEGYLRLHGIDAVDVESGGRSLRAKPAKGAYGCYGHLSGALGNMRFRKDLRQNLRYRGAYVIQHEMKIPTVTNTEDGQTYVYIDRNFFSTNGQKYEFMGGFRSLMPIDTPEALQGRNHGSRYTVWGEIF